MRAHPAGPLHAGFLAPPVMDRMRTAGAALDADPLGQSPFVVDAKLPVIPGT